MILKLFYIEKNRIDICETEAVIFRGCYSNMIVYLWYKK